MSARFWLFSMASAGAALAGGVSLGFYATTPQRLAVAAYEDSGFFVEQGQAATSDLTALNGPVDVRCTGCGPTLADRQRYADAATWNGYDDPLVQDYDAQDPARSEDLMTDVSDTTASPAHRLPDEAERLASDDDSAPHPIRVVQGVPIAAGQFQASIAAP